MKSATVYAIPVPSHVRQFMLHLIDMQQPHAVHQNTFMGRVVRMKVEKQPFRQLHKPERVEGPVYEFTLPTALKHYTITVESARQIGEMFEKMFQQYMIGFVLGNVVATQNERQAIRNFCKFYDIDPDDADLEVLRKVYRDYKDRVLKANGQAYFLEGPGRADLQSDYAIAS